MERRPILDDVARGPVATPSPSTIKSSSPFSTRPATKIWAGRSRVHKCIFCPAIRSICFCTIAWNSHATFCRSVELLATRTMPSAHVECGSCAASSVGNRCCSRFQFSTRRAETREVVLRNHTYTHQISYRRRFETGLCRHWLFFVCPTFPSCALVPLVMWSSFVALQSFWWCASPWRVNSSGHEPTSACECRHDVASLRAPNRSNVLRAVCMLYRNMYAIMWKASVRMSAVHVSLFPATIWNHEPKQIHASAPSKPRYIQKDTPLSHT